MADDDIPPSDIQYPGHDFTDVVSTTKQPDGTWLTKYDNGDVTVWPPPTVTRPTADWTPNQDNADNGDPWNIYKGSQPPFPAAPNVPGGADTPGRGVNVI